MRGARWKYELLSPLKLSFALLVLLAQLSGCARYLCSLPIEDEFGRRSVPVAIGSVADITPLSEDELLVVSQPPSAPLTTALTLIRTSREETIASIPPLFLSDERPYTSQKDGRWWFSTRGDAGAVSTVVFVVGGEPVQQTRVALPRQSPLVWLPVPAEEPRGLALSVANEQPALRIDEVTPSGAKPIGAFEWWDTGLQRTVLSSRWSAEALGRGRFAIVAVDGPDEAMTLRLRIIGGEEAVESVLPCSVPIDFPLATAVDGSGRLAVVGLSGERQVVAMVIDVVRPESARCRVISAVGETAAQPPFGTPSVVWTGEGFVGAWIRDDGSVRACELGDLRAAPSIIDIGEGADVQRPLRRLLHADAEYVTFLWRERGGAFVMRRMPRNLAGYALLAELRPLFCAAGGQAESTVR